jgi:hypothetical protein
MLRIFIVTQGEDRSDQRNMAAGVERARFNV